MNLDAAPLIVALFFIAAIVLGGFTLVFHRAGKIRGLYTQMAGALLGLIFAILIMVLVRDGALASVVGLVIFGWFYVMGRLRRS